MNIFSSRLVKLLAMKRSFSTLYNFEKSFGGNAAISLPEKSISWRFGVSRNRGSGSSGIKNEHKVFSMNDCRL